jgi:threonylcarbamoyladenosine tRNA methylthiotransferase MtaB
MATPRQVALHTLGCKLNFSETSSIRRQFEKAGYGVVDFSDVADIYVLNTCSVTEFADRKCRQAVRKVLRINPDAKVVVMGCYAQLKPQEIAEIPGVDLVLGAAEKFQIIEFIDTLDKAPSKGMVRAGSVEAVNIFESAFSFGDRTRSFLKVQDGCDYKCSFCTIPKARGKSRSAPVSEVVANARYLADQGCKEIVLTGVNIGDFGVGTAVIEGVRPKKDALFIDLIKELDLIEGIERYRISSIEPNLCSNEVIEFVAGSTRFVPHFHIPLQSGNDKILRMMRRRYKRNLYADRVKQIKSVMPHACIGVDVIVGFPGETDEDFQITFDFIRDLDISYMHVFTYSERPNTPAAEMPGKIPMEIRRMRNKKLRILSDKKRLQFYERHIGDQRPALLEHSKESGYFNGFTDNYIPVLLSASAGFDVNQIVQLRLEGVNEQGKMLGTFAGQMVK